MLSTSWVISRLSCVTVRPSWVIATWMSEELRFLGGYTALSGVRPNVPFYLPALVASATLEIVFLWPCTDWENKATYNWWNMEGRRWIWYRMKNKGHAVLNEAWWIAGTQSRVLVKPMSRSAITPRTHSWINKNILTSKMAPLFPISLASLTATVWPRIYFQTKI